MAAWCSFVARGARRNCGRSRASTWPRCRSDGPPMIDQFIAFSVRYRLLVILGAVALAVFGLRAVHRSPVDAIPDLSENQVLVFAAWPGHSPLEVEDQVTYPLALQLQGIEGVRVVRSSSDIHYSLLSVIMDDSIPMP